jgi:hypothetical protein
MEIGFFAQRFFIILAMPCAMELGRQPMELYLVNPMLFSMVIRERGR